MSVDPRWEPVIGLEVHAQLRTRSKIFCGCAALYGGEANSRCCPVCLGLPGALPVLNRAAIDLALKVGLALDCRVAARSVMARKNYFYPDLPKGYQISQFERPLCTEGALDISAAGVSRRIRIRRVHLEEDAGKSIHDAERTRVDLNRSGVPLIEIVSEPDLRDPAEAHEYLLRLRQLLVALAVCDGNMAEGSLRCDANVSLRPVGDETLGTRTELKNLTSFRGVEAALGYEIERQMALLASGRPVVHETRLWDAAAREARPMRGKEDSRDYRYFPEPDLRPVDVDDAWLTRVRQALPELPAARRARLERERGLPAYDADVLTAEPDLADYYEALADALGDDKAAANWTMGEVLRRAGERGERLADFTPRPPALADLLARVGAGAISNTAAKTVFERMVSEGGTAADWIERLGLAQVSDADYLVEKVDAAIAAGPAELARYRAGEKKLFGWFVGQVMAATGGKANPRETARLLRERLDGKG